jgi:hypothetical protein
MRLADNFKTLVSKDDIKKYHGTDPAFNDLPQEIKRILVNDFKDLVITDFNEILRLDNLDIPQGLELYEPKEHTNQPRTQFRSNVEDPDDMEPQELEEIDEEEEEDVEYPNYDPTTSKISPDPDVENMVTTKDSKKHESGSRERLPRNIPPESERKRTPSSTINQPTPSTSGLQGKKQINFPEKLKGKKYIKPQLNTIEENALEENNIENEKNILLPKQLPKQEKISNDIPISPTIDDHHGTSLPQEEDDEPDDDDSMKLRSGRRVRFEI